MNRQIADHVAAQFSMPYAISACANRVSPAEWQDPDKIKDPKILKFMDKVYQEPHPDFVKVFLAEPGSNLTAVEVVTKGRTFKAEGKYAMGHSPLGFTRMTDEDLVRRFRINASKVLPQDKIDKAIVNLTDLEKVGDISEVIKQVTL